MRLGVVRRSRRLAARLARRRRSCGRRDRLDGAPCCRLAERHGRGFVAASPALLAARRALVAWRRAAQARRRPARAALRPACCGSALAALLRRSRALPGARRAAGGRPDRPPSRRASRGRWCSAARRKPATRWPLLASPCGLLWQAVQVEAKSCAGRAALGSARLRLRRATARRRLRAERDQAPQRDTMRREAERSRLRPSTSTPAKPRHRRLRQIVLSA